MLEQEWINLMLEAKHIGITIDEIREFIIANTDKKDVLVQYQLNSR